jgi:hypothetical protein
METPEPGADSRRLADTCWACLWDHAQRGYGSDHFEKLSVEALDPYLASHVWGSLSFVKSVAVATPRGQCSCRRPRWVK